MDNSQHYFESLATVQSSVIYSGLILHFFLLLSQISALSLLQADKHRPIPRSATTFYPRRFTSGHCRCRLLVKGHQSSNP